MGKQEGAIQITCINVFVCMYFLIFAGESVSGRRNGSWSRGKKMRGKRGGKGPREGLRFLLCFPVVAMHQRETVEGPSQLARRRKTRGGEREGGEGKND